MRTDLLRDLRPAEETFDPDSPAALAALERILAAPPEPPSRPPRRAGRRLALAGAAALAAVAAVVAAPLLHGSPDVVARAADALAQPSTILHFQAEIRSRESATELRAGRPGATVDDVVESWQGEGRARSVFRNGREVVLDTATGRGEEYLGAWDAIATLDLRDGVVQGAGAKDAPGLGARALPTGVVGDLARLLARARDGDEDIHLVGETTVRGTPAYELRLGFTIATGKTTLRLSRLIYVDRESYLPLRDVELGPHGEIWTETDYVKAERLPVTPETRADLQMRAHPGAARPDADGVLRLRVPSGASRPAG
jgi:hypothetical protein